MVPDLLQNDHEETILNLGAMDKVDQHMETLEGDKFNQEDYEFYGLKNFLGGWLLVLGIKECLVECTTVCVKSVVILMHIDSDCTAEKL